MTVTARAGQSTVVRPQVIMFDLDGTLVDTMGGFADLAGEVMERFHGAGREVARARYLETSGHPFLRQLELIHPGHAANALASLAFEARKRDICERVSMPGRTRCALERLRARGLGLVVSSNSGQSFVDDFVRREDFAFDMAFGYEAATGLEKGPPHVARVLERFGLAEERVWFVGDSLNDGVLAQACGVRFVGRVGTFSRRAFEAHLSGVWTIDEFEELERLVDEGV